MRPFAFGMTTYLITYRLLYMITHGDFNSDASRTKNHYAAGDGAFLWNLRFAAGSTPRRTYPRRRNL